MSHVRPCGWEQYVDGFPFSRLVRDGFGWYLGHSDLYAQPFGAVHMYGHDTGVDAMLDAVGVVRTSYTSPELQAFQSIVSNEYYPVTSIFGEVYYYDVRPYGVSLWPSNIGNLQTYCTADAIHTALSAEGFAFNQIRLVQPIDVELFDPGADEVEVDTYTQAIDPGTGLLIAPVGRLRTTISAILPTPTSESGLQLASSDVSFYEIAAERPMRASLVTRNISGTPDSLRTTGPTSGPVADSMDRFLGEYVISGEGVVPVWSAVVLARSGITAKVLCLPCRRLLSEDRAEDSTGPRTRLGLADFDYNSPLVLPDAVARPKWLTVSGGSEITLSMLAGTETPAYPEKHHVWQLHPVDGSIEVM